MDDAVSLRSFKAKGREKRGVVGVGGMNLYAVEDERQGFDLVMTMKVVIRVIAVWTCIPLWYVENYIPPFSITEIMLNP